MWKTFSEIMFNLSYKYVKFKIYAGEYHKKNHVEFNINAGGENHREIILNLI